MAEESKDADPADAAPAKPGGVLPYLIVGILCTAAGVAVPFLLPLLTSTEAAPVPPPYELPRAEDTVFVPFGEVAVNLDDQRLNRFLKVSITLQVAKEHQVELVKKLETQTVPLKSWLLSHLSDKTLEESRGAAGQNRLRREIRNEFNTILYPDGYDRIYDVLFDNYAVQ